MSQSRVVLLCASALIGLLAWLWASDGVHQSTRSRISDPAHHPRNLSVNDTSGATPRRSARGGSPETAQGATAANTIAPAMGTATPTLRGRVLAESRPVFGAHVYLSASRATQGSRTTRDGRFSFVAEGHWRLTASHADYGRAELQVDLHPGVTSDVTLELVATEELVVRAVDSGTGEPVRGASVHLIAAGRTDGVHGWNQECGLSRQTLLELSSLADVGSGRPRRWELAIPAKKTDIDGVAVLGPMPEGTADLVVLHKGHAPGVRRYAPSRGEVAVFLRSASRLLVRGPNVHGKPASGYVCEVYRAGGGHLTFPTAVQRLSKEAQAEFDGLPGGEYLVSVSKEGSRVYRVRMGTGNEAPGVPPSSIAARRVAIPCGGTATVDFASGGAKVELRALVGGKPRDIWLAVLLATQASLEQVGEAEGGSDGIVVFSGVQPGRYRAVVALDRRLNTSVDFIVKPETNIIPLTIDVVPGQLHGRTLDADDSPVANARIRVSRVGAPSTVDNIAGVLAHIQGREYTDAAGRFTAGEIVPGPYRCLCLAGTALDLIECDVAAGEKKQVEFRFAEGRQQELVIALQDDSGSPVDGKVTVALLEDETATPLEFDSTAGAVASRYSFHLPDGRYRIEASAEGHVHAAMEYEHTGRSGYLELRLGTGPRTYLVLLQAGLPRAGVAVEVRDATGTRVGIRRQGSRLVSPRTDDSGVAYLGALRPGRYHARWPGGERAFLVSEGRKTRIVDVSSPD